MTGQRVEAAGLTERFGGHTAVDGVTFTVEPGRITGFLGPNGAGKTTTMRMITGQVAPTAGAATFHPRHSARDHLRVYASMGGHPDGRVDELLDVLGPAPAARRATRGFSTGMRQRLALATALLGNPPVLLLGEPGNGVEEELDLERLFFVLTGGGG
ncbi:ATP-binding cassette domain-containing protein [Actinomadura algeriensis]|uniref:ABC-type multidrug transport system ATPase subunit n=1 Tax=Actinomadura algeriensis TaxID=1679523 RepID=A0ABR9K3X3_9ACTN|nr:ATP-binding cassette domain-containing protein [Actinomadura algeriensis]MBE1537517.1 ABC-type multidrug transport system ATPase subunit [Actinomadura algeriensis]